MARISYAILLRPVPVKVLPATAFRKFYTLLLKYGVHRCTTEQLVFTSCLYLFPALSQLLFLPSILHFHTSANQKSHSGRAAFLVAAPYYLCLSYDSLVVRSFIGIYPNVPDRGGRSLMHFRIVIGSVRDFARNFFGGILKLVNTFPQASCEFRNTFCAE